MKSSHMLSLDMHVRVIIAFESPKPSLNGSQRSGLVHRFSIFNSDMLSVHYVFEWLSVINPFQTTQSVSNGNDVKCL
jgi:hypothetical protein